MVIFFMKKPNLRVYSFEEAFSFGEFLKAHKICRRNKGHKREVIEFELNLYENALKLSSSVLNGTYKIVKYRKFEIFEPKKRIIESLPYKHRLVQYLLCKNILEPMLEPRFIHANAACRCGKGTDFARNLFETYLRKVAKKYKGEAYFLKCDVRKYFASINHKFLLEKFEKLPFEEKTFSLLKMIIKSGGETKGLPIGNLTSQWSALFYLNNIDRIIKEQFQMKYYVRYMDDLVLISNDYTKLLEVKKRVVFEGEKLGLIFNEKTQISKVSQGITFIGYRYVITKSGKLLKLLTQNTKKRIKSNLKRLYFLKNNNLADADFLDVRVGCYLNFYKNSSMGRDILKTKKELCK